MVSANGVVASGWMEGSQCSWVETVHDRRNSTLYDSETQNTHLSKVGGSKKVFDNK